MMEQYQVKAAKGLQGVIDVPGDKSISHRAIMLSCLANEPVVIKNFLFSKNCLSTIECFRKLGIVISYSKDSGTVWVAGNGLNGLQEPDDILEAGNSGTTIKLMTGILACQDFFSVITGANDIRQQPVPQIIDPLTKMGAKLYCRAKNRKIPIAVLPVSQLRGADFITDVDSAQVKSTILLAGLYALGPTRVTELHRSRDHTERMLESFGVDIAVNGLTVTLYPPEKLIAPAEIFVPGDISSAAYWIVAASIIPNSCITLTNVGINSTRTGVIDVLRQMGARIEMKNQRFFGHEEVADITVSTAPLHSVVIQKEQISQLIDEIPVLVVAALFAEGTTCIDGVYELHVKDPDRLSTVAGELTKLGAKLIVNEDSFIIEGPQQLVYAVCDSRYDHRIAMAMAIAGLASKGTKIHEAECVQNAYPLFFNHLEKLSV
ncbi:3-phosphoshikimate 1-carboxyvinyltransferase [Sporomusaceae bacterium BoRhaA]|uniref:3-phosphoshikimate 1-carboxyvinyltransferase n=1 Tax=Pelorhabdus rhamnosifermentans TaxID=2772457 RepID=UPI0028AF48E5|nr:3-phosphoshikimate 1-carboxyvinyltransferase [Pelorhabdus rhamnosifermentans]MBU2701023.1 3-phosphoshikimate 1-carboxyvinyltransferase [Pelorhabdus rhamnosifermentans]